MFFCNTFSFTHLYRFVLHALCKLVFALCSFFFYVFLFFWPQFVDSVFLYISLLLDLQCAKFFEMKTMLFSTQLYIG